MDITQRIDDLAQVLESAKSRSLGGGAIVDREKALQLIADIRASLPTELAEAQDIIASAGELRAAAQKQADAVVAAVMIWGSFFAGMTSIWSGRPPNKAKI